MSNLPNFVSSSPVLQKVQAVAQTDEVGLRAWKIPRGNFFNLYSGQNKFRIRYFEFLVNFNPTCYLFGLFRFTSIF